MIRLTAALILIMAAPAWADDRSPSPEGAAVYIISPADRATVESPVTVRFGLRGMGVAPAGVAKANTGHHHLFIDHEGVLDLLYALPNDANHRHLGGGQTEVTLDLAPGSHSLQMVLGDHNHVPHAPPVVSDKITITVE